MDCEKFESAMMDELYGELDELTSAAAKRHVAGCSRCSALIGGLRATRRVATVPLVDVPTDLEDRILAAVKEAQKVVPIGRRVAGAVSMAGSWAMRPQTAMAALFLVMIGTSVLLLRGKSARAPLGADVRVTEQGAPAAEPPMAAASPTVTAAASPAASGAVTTLTHRVDALTSAAPSPSPAALGEDLRGTVGYKGLSPKDKDDEAATALNASTPGGIANTLPPAPAMTASPHSLAAPKSAQQMAQGPANDATGGGPNKEEAQARKIEAPPLSAAQQLYRAGRFDEASRAFDALAPSDPNAELWAARSVREGKGCSSALARFDKVAQRAGGTATGWDALLEGALCYRAVGNSNAARVRLTALLKVDSHKDRAQAELDRLNQQQQAQGGQGAAAPAARPSPKRSAPTEQRPAASPPQSDSDPNAAKY